MNKLHLSIMLGVLFTSITLKFEGYWYLCFVSFYFTSAAFDEMIIQNTFIAFSLTTKSFPTKDSGCRYHKIEVPYLGNQFSNSFLVSSGCFVLFLNQFNLLAILWTWVSTPIPITWFQAHFITRYAILGPTPGSLHNFSTESGMSPSYSSWRILDVLLIYSTFLCNTCYSHNQKEN